MLTIFLLFAFTIPLGVSNVKFSERTFARVLNSFALYFDWTPYFSLFGAIFSSMYMLQFELL